MDGPYPRFACPRGAARRDASQPVWPTEAHRRSRWPTAWARVRRARFLREAPASEQQARRCGGVWRRLSFPRTQEHPWRPSISKPAGRRGGDVFPRAGRDRKAGRDAPQTAWTGRRPASFYRDARTQKTTGRHCGDVFHRTGRGRKAGLGAPQTAWTGRHPASFYRDARTRKTTGRHCGAVWERLPFPQRRIHPRRLFVPGPMDVRARDCRKVWRVSGTVARCRKPPTAWRRNGEVRIFRNVYWWA